MDDPLDFYGWTVMPTQTNATAAVYWAWAHRFWKCAADCNNNWDSVLLSSRDGLHFDYIGGSREPWLRPGPDGGMGSRMVHVMPTPIEVGNELWIYVAMTNQNHAGIVDPASPTGKKETAIGLIKMRRDGLVSLDAPLFHAPATLSTKSIVVSSSAGQTPSFQVNVVCSGGGVLRAGLVDTVTGTVIPGFGITNSVRVLENAVDAPLLWTQAGKQNGTASRWPGDVKQVRVEMQLQGCELYALALG
jgi:hypothetical protein